MWHQIGRGLTFTEWTAQGKLGAKLEQVLLNLLETFSERWRVYSSGLKRESDNSELERELNKNKFPHIEPWTFAIIFFGLIDFWRVSSRGGT